MNAIAKIEGIGAAYADKLRAAGIISVQDLLEKGAQRGARAKLAADTGISEKLVLKWVNMADLFRIKGIGSQYAELLERSGVDTVRELAQRNATTLRAKMTEVNTSTKLVRQTPSERSVVAWIAEAKQLPVKVTY
jgi:predicted flap endonuclease-1-like 5' DNA nuclease